MDAESPTIPAAVAAFVREARSRHGITKDQLAREVRGHGLNWSVGSIGNLESGTLSLTLPVLVILADALGDLLGESIRLADFFSGAESITLAKQSRLPAAALREILEGAPVELERPVLEPRIARLLAKPIREAPPGMMIGELIELERRESSLAELRAAEKLDVSLRALKYWAAFLWSRSLEEEAAARAGVGASAQAKGHATRQLIVQLDDAIPQELRLGVR